jgi:hypothetical protein
VAGAVAFLVMRNQEYRVLKDTLDREDSRSTAKRHYVGLDLHPPELDVHDLAELLRRQAPEGEDLVQAVQELRTEEPTHDVEHLVLVH